MAELTLSTVLRRERRSVTATDDDRCALGRSLDRSVEQRLGAAGERLELEDTRGTVPEDRLRGEDSLLEELSTLRAGV